jgi:hypothetical protein
MGGLAAMDVTTVSRRVKTSSSALTSVKLFGLIER